MPTYDITPTTAGIDLKATRDFVRLDSLPIHYLDATSSAATSSTDPETAAQQLATAGYWTIAYKTPAGQPIQCIPDGASFLWRAQPRSDKYWITAASLDAVLALTQRWARTDLLPPN